MPPKTLPSFMNTQIKQKTPSKVDLIGKTPLKSRAGSPANTTMIDASATPSRAASSDTHTPSRSFCRRNLFLLLIFISIVFCVIFSPFELWYTDSFVASPKLTVDPSLLKVAQTYSHVDEAAFVFTGPHHHFFPLPNLSVFLRLSSIAFILSRRESG